MVPVYCNLPPPGVTTNLPPSLRTPPQSAIFPPTFMLTQDSIRDALKAVKYPGYSRDIVSFGLVKEVAVNGGAVSVTIQLTTAHPEAVQQIKAESERVLHALPGVEKLFVEVKQSAPAQQPHAQSAWAGQNRVPGIKRVIAVPIINGMLGP